jgi:two-component system, chemotaxis family, chemotaxis protein CheY
MRPGKNKKSVTQTILLVDDDLELTEVLSELLEKEGYSTVQAQNGQKALDILKEMPRFPVLIVLDMTMPVLDGRGFLAHRAHDSSLIGIPVIVVSGSDLPAVPLLDIKAYLRKPVTIRQLMSIIESM